MSEARPPLRILKRRSEFLAANGGRRVPMPAFVLLVRAREDGDPAIGMGFTVTKKIGGAVIRNRIKRRFRALAREFLPADGIAGADHVLIGRSAAITHDHHTLVAEFRKALGKARGPAPQTIHPGEGRGPHARRPMDPGPRRDGR